MNYQTSKAGVCADSLSITTKHYFYKPSLVWVRAFELDEYARARIAFESPVMDLGCGDGTFGAMMRDMGLVSSISLSAEYSMKDLLQGKKREPVARYARVDSTALPIRDGVFASVFSNGVICCLSSERDNDVDASISEVNRVLKVGGLFVMTVATPLFAANLVMPKLLQVLGMPSMAQKYLSRMNRRLTHFFVYDELGWRKKLEKAGFQVEQVRYYFTQKQAFWWNILSLHLLRIFAILKVISIRWVNERIANFWEKVFRPFFEKEQLVLQADKESRAGYLLLVSRKIPVHR